MAANYPHVRNPCWIGSENIWYVF